MRGGEISGTNKQCMDGCKGRGVHVLYMNVCGNISFHSICGTLGIKNVACTLLKGSVVDNSYGLCFLYKYITFMLLLFWGKHVQSSEKPKN